MSPGRSASSSTFRRWASVGKPHTQRGAKYSTVKKPIIVVTLLLILASVPLPHVCAQESDMSFVADVTIPDDTVIQPGEVFTKTWRLQNSGGVDWLGYSLQFASGDQMAGVPQSVPKTGAGETADVTVVFTAPETDGTYTSSWELVDEAGDPVGSEFYVRVVVGTQRNEKEKRFFESWKSGATSHVMNEQFTVAGLSFMVEDVFRNESIWDVDQPVVPDGVFAIVRFEVTSLLPQTVNLTDRVLILLTDYPGNVYDSSYRWGTKASQAGYAAPRLFGDGVPVSTEIEPTYASFPVICTEEVGTDTYGLLFEVIDRLTNEAHWVHLQPLASESEMRYAGEFIDAPARE